MGGVCAVIDFRGRTLETGVIESMMTAADHRAVNGAMAWEAPDAALAQLTTRATQGASWTAEPVVSGDLVIVADARIDNRAFLLAELTSEIALAGGSTTDCDLILAAFRRWGRIAPERLLGDFTFVIWNTQAKMLFAARDTSGIRPLYVSAHGGRFYVASEVKQILAATHAPVRINEAMVGAYLASTAGMPQWTFYEGIEQIPAAHSVEAKSGHHSVSRYWDVDPNAVIEYRTELDYAAHLRQVLTEAIRSRMAPDVPMGVWLSGGLDSGAVAATMGHLQEQGQPGSVRAFSFAFDELDTSDERHVSHHIVDRYGFAASDIAADDAWPLRDLPLHGPDRDEPLMGAFQVLHDRVYAAAEYEGIGAMFTGASGDTICGGDVFDYPGELKRRPLRAMQHLHRHAQADEMSLPQVLARRVMWPVAASLMPDRMEHLVRTKVLRKAHNQSFPSWIRQDFAERVSLEEATRWAPSGPPFRSGASGLRYQAINDLFTRRGLVWNERNHARHGLALLDPWSDRRLAQFTIGVPQWLLNRGDERKALVREAMRGVMPEAARRLAGKFYPDALYKRGIRERENSTVEHLLRTSRLAEMGIVDRDALIGGLRRGTDEGAEWPVLSTEIWLRTYWE